MEEVKTKIPAIRFPEFDVQWRSYMFGDIYDYLRTNSLSRSQLNYDDGEIKNIHYGDIHTKFEMNFRIDKERVPYVNKDIDLSKVEKKDYCRVGDLVIADASEDYNDIGKTIEIREVREAKLVAGLHTYLARDYKSLTALGFMGYYQQVWSVRLQKMKFATGISVLGISKTNLGKVNLHLPSLPEQQKIASFLTAVDDKTQHLTKKKELLEQYKKGVMQKIFSQEIRFRDEDGSEFPDWEEKKLGEVCEFENGKAHETSIVENGKYIVVNSKFISSEGKVKKHSNSLIVGLRRGDLVMVMSDIPNGKALAKCFYIKTDGTHTLNQRICAIRSKKVETKYLYYILNRNRYYLKFDSGVGQTNLRKDEVLSCPLNISLSTKEQQKIANVLTSIDKKIELVNTQLEKTKEFKKGLLQQMFV